MLGYLGRWAERVTTGFDAWPRVLGVGRTIMALGTLSYIVVNHTDYLFRPTSGRLDWPPTCSDLNSFGIFCLAGREYLELARWIVVAILLVVASGWRPRFTGILHWWVVFSYASATMISDGGDQIHAILALILIPLTLMDGRRWHWSKAPPADNHWLPTKRIVALFVWTLFRIQMAVIYFDSSFSKIFSPHSGEEWKDGTVVYYWFTDHNFGIPDHFMWFMSPILLNGVGVLLLSWLPVILEIAVASTVLFGSPRGRRIIFPVAVAFHLGIVFLHGLLSFGLIMIGAWVIGLLGPSMKVHPFEAHRTMKKSSDEVPDTV